MFRQARLFCLLFLLAVLLASYATVVMAQQNPIIFNDSNWGTIRIQNRIAQYMIEKGYGYVTDAVPGGELDSFTGLRQGESDVMMEIWFPNMAEAWQEASIVGEVVSLGVSVDGIVQSAFVIPAYLQEAHPELDSVEDLKKAPYQSLFAVSESGGKARLVSCPASWACHSINQMQVTGYGLADHVYVHAPESEAAKDSELFDLYEKGEPWLGYLESVTEPWIRLDLVQLEEPAHSDLCWATTKACASREGMILIAASPDLLERAPEVSQMLRKWKLNAAVFSSMSSWKTASDASYADTAVWWLNENEALWSQWVTEAAAIAIREALGRGERAEGWPDE